MTFLLRQCSNLMRQENKGVASQVRWHGRAAHGEDEGAGSRDPRLKKRYIDEQMVCEKSTALTMPASIKPGLFHGFHARAAKQWQKHSAVQCD
jgi:hypothetical protein